MLETPQAIFKSDAYSQILTEKYATLNSHMRQNRQNQEIREIKITPSFNEFADGSALVVWGKTKVLATVKVDNKLPPHMRNQKTREGWLTAEYAMLPGATQERTQRERLYASGRTQEIQRLIGRSLRTIVDLNFFPNKTLMIDVDVLQADGGTRCAAILAGYAALHEYANKLIFSGELDEWPLSHEIAAVSVGQIKGENLLDLEFTEDSNASLDLNVVATARGELVEVQGGTEGKPVPAETYVQLIALGIEGVKKILETTRAQLS